ncbi:ribonuclease H1-like [Ostrea edulis]|uniref:ribonuclease H1-like n=1 Tax=Ostrea edulis TaxID=37623 RepID=UPI0024AEE1FE|nr:ribonuclease H1-like [Ostrea edulis]
MGSIMGKAMDENLKKNQKFMLEVNQLTMERQIQMQNQMREKQMAMMVARGRDIFQWFGAFYGTYATFAILANMKTKGKAKGMIAPLLPLTFILGYQYDLAYGSKVERMRQEADRVLDTESSLLNLPHGLPTFDSIEKGRLKTKDASAVSKGHDIFLWRVCSRCDMLTRWASRPLFIPFISTTIRVSVQKLFGEGSMPFYAVRRGRNVGIFNDWDSCKEQVNGYGGARYKKFNSVEEAQAFVNGSDDGSCSTSSAQTKDSLSSYCGKSGNPQQKKYTSGVRSTPYSINDRQYSSWSSSSKKSEIDLEDAEDDHVYTDGCCLNNGQENSVAGVGVYWGPSHPSNVSERLPGRPTNNRAEIHAARIAVKQAKEKGMKSVTVLTDSQLLINGMTSWIHNWKKNGWTLSDNTKVKNTEDWKALDTEMTGINVKFKYVPGHKGVDGNEKADRLANEGAMKVAAKSGKSWFW